MLYSTLPARSFNPLLVEVFINEGEYQESFWPEVVASVYFLVGCSPVIRKDPLFGAKLVDVTVAEFVRVFKIWVAVWLGW